MRPKIYISGIDNLTDARYFSAMGADYLGFQMDDPAMLIKALGMIDWVEGPEIVAETSSLSLSEGIKDALKTGHFQHIKVGAFMPLEEIDVPVGYIFSEALDVPSIPAQVPVYEAKAGQSKYEENCFFKFAIQDLLDQPIPHVAGIILSAGTEEKIGFKDFDQFDQFFEKLDDQF